MKYSKFFRALLGCSDPQEVFSYLMTTLKKTISSWDYFVNWAKVFDNIREVEIDLNILNYLIGKEDIENEFASLLKKHPSVARLVPVLIACRENKFDILSSFDKDSFKYDTYDFSKPDQTDISKVVEFASSVGFLDLLKSKRIKSIVDYVIGVEVGLDSNGRKNRGGKAMEAIVEFFVKDICQRNNYEYIREATYKKVKEKWGLRLEVDKTSRRVDFVINKNDHLYLIEVNFYSGGGSKLKSTAGEYKAVSDFWKKVGYEFIWITDGVGWRTTERPLAETFEYIDYILNLEMVTKGLLEGIITEPA